MKSKVLNNVLKLLRGIVPVWFDSKRDWQRDGISPLMLSETAIVVSGGWASGHPVSVRALLIRSIAEEIS